MKAMEFYAHLLKGKEFKVVTDTSTLKEIHTLKDVNPIFMSGLNHWQ